MFLLRINKLTLSQIRLINPLQQHLIQIKAKQAHFTSKINLQNKFNLNQIIHSKKLNMEFNKKRKRLEEAEKEKKENVQVEENNSNDESFEIDENGVKRLNLPKKSKYRMRAHCNPLAGVSIA